MSAGIVFNNGLALTTTAAGTAGQVLTSQGSGSPPIWGAGGGGGGGSPVIFQAWMSASVTNATGAGAVYNLIYDQIVINTGSGYDPSTGIFTAPVTGTYQFRSFVTVQGVNDPSYTGFEYNYNATGYVNACPSDLGAYNIADQGNGGQISYPTSCQIYMNAGDTISTNIQVTGGATDNLTIFGYATQSGFTAFAGFLVQAASSGSLTPLFFARATTPQNNVSGDGTLYTIQYQVTDYNVSSCFDVSTGQFTVPSTGLYRFEAGISMNGFDATNTNVDWTLIDNTTNVSTNLYYLYPNPYTTTTNMVRTAIQYSTPSIITAGDVISTYIQITGASPNISIYADPSSNYTWWAAYKLS